MRWSHSCARQACSFFEGKTRYGTDDRDLDRRGEYDATTLTQESCAMVVQARWAFDTCACLKSALLFPALTAVEGGPNVAVCD